MLLLGIMLPPTKPPRNRIIKKTELDDKVKEKKVAEAITITFGAFFWLLLIILFALAIIKLID